MKKLLVVLVIGSLAVLAGCFQIEQSMKLERDLSGSAGFTLGIDFEPMVLIMLQFQREMEGKEGPPTQEEIANAKREFAEKMTAEEGVEDVEADRQRVRESLPKGVTLRDMSVDRQEMKLVMNFVFDFDHVSKLSQITLPQKDGAGPESEMLVDRPFADLQVVDEGDTILITSKPSNPTEAVADQTQEAGAPESPELEEMMKKAFEDLRVAWEIDAPFDVVEHNATRVEGTKLIWEYDVAALETMENEGSDAQTLQLRVRYRK